MCPLPGGARSHIIVPANESQGLVTITIGRVSGVGLALRANPARDRYKVRHMALDVALEDHIVEENNRLLMDGNPVLLVDN